MKIRIRKGLKKDLPFVLNLIKELAEYEKLLDEVKNSDTFENSEIMKEIETNHAKILENRPIPELLDTADLINNLEDLKPPIMGKLYEEKKEIKKEKDRFFTKE